MASKGIASAGDPSGGAERESASRAPKRALGLPGEAGQLLVAPRRGRAGRLPVQARQELPVALGEWPVAAVARLVEEPDDVVHSHVLDPVHLEEGRFAAALGDLLGEPLELLVVL